jgi:cell division protease FtsH
MSRHERERTAYHEGAHTVVAHFLEHHDPPHKVTIIARGMAGGYTRFLPDEEARYRTREMLEDQLAAALAGGAAEKLVFGQASTGPSEDIEQVTRLARTMVTRWGMSERLGPRTFGRSEELVFLGREISETRNYSEKIAEEIDDEVRRLIETAQGRARQLLVKHRPLLDKLATALLEVETLDGEALQQLLNSDPLERWVSPDHTGDHAPTDPAAPVEVTLPGLPEPAAPAAGLAWNASGVTVANEARPQPHESRPG